MFSHIVIGGVSTTSQHEIVAFDSSGPAFPVSAVGGSKMYLDTTLQN